MIRSIGLGTTMFNGQFWHCWNFLSIILRYFIINLFGWFFWQKYVIAIGPSWEDAHVREEQNWRDSRNCTKGALFLSFFCDFLPRKPKWIPKEADYLKLWNSIKEELQGLKLWTIRGATFSIIRKIANRLHGLPYCKQTAENQLFVTYSMPTGPQHHLSSMYPMFRRICKRQTKRWRAGRGS